MTTTTAYTPDELRTIRNELARQPRRLPGDDYWLVVAHRLIATMDTYWSDVGDCVSEYNRRGRFTVKVFVKEGS